MVHPILALSSGLGPHPAWLLPFGLLLLAIAVMPFISHRWWERHYPKVSVGLGGLVVAYYLFGLHDGGRMLHVAHEYLSFIALIGSLFVVAGGIHICVKGESTPAVNCLFLLLGAALANLIGTTGASMLLIRPWLRMNKYRVTAFHVAFFIFIVSNVGGCLTPVGDPPLFLGYLRGVPFWWTLQHCWPAWLVAVGGLLAVFYVLDRRNFLRAPAPVRKRETAHETWRFDGLGNLGWLAVILGAVFIERPAGLRELLMVLAAVASFVWTPQSVHQANHFTFRALAEVAWLFAGIFATMVPALDYLQTHAHGLGLDSPLKFYWAAGSLSSVLDNAPTYITFLAAGMGTHDLSVGIPGDVLAYAAKCPRELLAISLGAVFFGAMTYIGNGPNFMVKSIAEHANVRVPGFGGYLVRYALPFLLPVLVVVGLLFFSRVVS
jgi:Na+/H+ antiporter NhaD/arsenite permease-like protein